MKFLNFIKRTIPVFIGILILWGGLFFYSAILNRSNEKIVNFIPENANFELKVHLKDFIKASTYSLVFNSKDQALLNVFRNYLNKQRKGTGKSNEFGIDFTKDITIYGENVNGSQVYVLLFELTRPELFTKNLPYFLNENQGFKTIDNTGFLISYFGKEKNQKQFIAKYVAEIKENTKDDTQGKLKSNKSSFFDITFEKYDINEKFRIDKGNLSCSVDENKLNFDGKLNSTFEKIKHSDWSLLPEGIHIKNSIISATIQDSINSFVQNIGIQIPKIEQFSINYHGIEIQETDKGIIFTPIFDLILNFKDEFTVSSLFENAQIIEDFGFEFSEKEILAGKVKYYLDSLDSKTLFIGTKVSSLVHRKNKNIFEASGDLSKLTEIKGSGFIVSFINLLPQFKASKNLFNSIEKMEIATKSDQGKIEIKGEISFKKEVYLYNELLRFYLTFKGEY